MTVIACEWPYMTFPACNQTFAEFMGSTYTGYQVVFCLLFIPLFLVTLWQYLLAIQKQHWSFNPGQDVQVQILTLLVIGTATMVVRAADVYGWAGNISIYVNNLMYDIGSAAGVCCVFVIVWSWYSFLSKSTFKRTTSKLPRLFYRGSIIVVWITQIVCCTLQYNAGIYWQAVIVKYAITNAIMFSWLVFGFWYGLQIYRMLVIAEKKFGKLSESTAGSSHARPQAADVSGEEATEEEVAEEDDDDADVEAGTAQQPNPNNRASGGSLRLKTNPAVAGAAAAPTASKHKSSRTSRSTGGNNGEGIRSRRRARAIRKIFALLRIMIAVLVACVAVLIWSISSNASSQYDLKVDGKPLEVPTGSFSMVTPGLFDYVHFIAFCVLLHAYRVTGAQEKPVTQDTTEDTDRNSTLKSSQKRRKANRDSFDRSEYPSQYEKSVAQPEPAPATSSQSDLIVHSVAPSSPKQTPSSPKKQHAAVEAQSLESPMQGAEDLQDVVLEIPDEVRTSE
ncbi:hypothetical protein CAOG_08546 [Capsaspora owczarzaki ATCC 30864]|uniref:Transmembrane protein n=1 Tax=Capsaspora owczarzaki (strain ATCC 30864) TaxID=595528 RepID=A0A0D2X1A2_CAPO3|nr:hypothetical protein CAOG_08546 [Capsaspora owczarzaki ATCC 30864]KJE90454.1 hypothetical protein CAOG_008546 [Capsaspora owczarzaki ATCC 30864]|eukprot:XP_011270128.1 hypothetical protein CAOG_08546 [Capsaspora owczarzaki ATCC 30864]